MSVAARRTMLVRILAIVAGACGGQAEPPPSPSPSPPATPDASANAQPAEPFPSTQPPSPPPASFEPPADCAQANIPPRWTSSCAADAGSVDAGHAQGVCFPLPEAGTCESAYRSECVLWGYDCGLIQKGDAVLCRAADEDACCWIVSGGCAVGRPFVVEGTATVARAVASDAWCAPEIVAAARPLADATHARARRSIADVWEREGLAEHASVASFARFSLELLALGAPADLVAAAQRAMGEEIAHAQRCFALASAYAGSARGPGALDTSGALGATIDMADFAARTAAEGCIAETVAALQLRAAAEAAVDPVLSALLEKTADEEDDHALLAWRTVRWAVETGGLRVQDAVRDVFARASAHVGFGAHADDHDDLREHGVLSRRERHDLALAALASVIAPAAEQLLSRGTASLNAT